MPTMQFDAEAIWVFIGIFALIALIKGPGILRDVRSVSSAGSAYKIRKAAHANDVVHVFENFNPADRTWLRITPQARRELLAQGYKPTGNVLRVADDGFGISDFDARQWAHTSGAVIWVCA